MCVCVCEVVSACVCATMCVCERTIACVRARLRVCVCTYVYLLWKHDHSFHFYLFQCPHLFFFLLPSASHFYVPWPTGDTCTHGLSQLDMPEELLSENQMGKRGTERIGGERRGVKTQSRETRGAEGGKRAPTSKGGNGKWRGGIK